MLEDIKEVMLAPLYLELKILMFFPRAGEAKNTNYGPLI